MTRWKRLLSFLAACGIVGACSGPSFTESEASAGASGSGGTDAGEGGQGAEGGTTPSGGGTAGTAGNAGAREFPSYGVLDDFNRDAVAVGPGWIGETNAYAIESETLVCPADYCSGIFWHEAFGGEQEVFATIVSFSGISPEINLVLKAQGDPSCELMEVLYAPATGQVSLEACWQGQWISFGSTPADLSPGDQLGARARSNGIVEVFKNGILLDSFDANEFPYYELDGYIGVDGIVATNAVPNVWDDFGGGGG